MGRRVRAKERENGREHADKARETDRAPAAAIDESSEDFLWIAAFTKDPEGN